LVLKEEESAEDSFRAGPSQKRGEAPAFPFAAIPLRRPGAAGAVFFDRSELQQILSLYGRKVCDGEWRDYAIDFTPQKAVFSIYRRSCECALYRIEKNPRFARKQGAYSVITATGLVLKRGHELGRVISVLDRSLKLVPA
jgi:hypothetical protein